MDNNRRFLLAIALSALALFAFNFLAPRPATPPAAPVAARSSAETVPGRAVPGAPAGQPAPTAPGAAPTVGPSTVTPAAVPAARAETVLVAGARAAYEVSSQGAALVGAEMRGYRNLYLGGARQREGQPPVQLARRGEPLLSFRLVVPGDTLALSRVPFAVTRNAGGSPHSVRLDGVASGRTVQNVPVSVTYTFAPDSYTVKVSASARNAPTPAFLLVDLPATIAPTERDTAEHYNALSVAWKPRNGSADGEKFAELDAGERLVEPDTLSWAVTKSKYFLVGALAPAGAAGFTQLEVTGGTRTSEFAERAQATLVAPLGAGVAFDLYAGPQEWRRLAAQGRDFEQANPYGGWFQGVIQPFATMAIRGILWLHDNLRLGYGWVLVLLGVLVRLVMWPLQQKMMRNQIVMQRLQPELQLVQQRYKQDPQRMQQEIMKVYAAHNMTPFAPLAGCLPMLLPMPIFLALFFVFQNTIEFRGVPFLWMSDISLKDPYYVLPVLVAVTQGLISWIGMRGAPPNPQAQLLTYGMPAMFLFFFANVAGGLNLYYLTQNLVMIPQQWLLARERAKAAPPTPPVQGTPVRNANPKLRPA